MTRQGVEVLPVVDAGNVVGQLSMASVLRAQGQQTDPMTGLPWATALRSWATNALKRGHEISILFIDLDNFGEVNKVLGHVAGDDLLRSIAHLLGSLIDPRPTSSVGTAATSSPLRRPAGPTTCARWDRALRTKS